MRIAAVAVLVFTALSGCDGGGNPTIEPTLSSIQQEVFTPSCALAGCHGATLPGAGLELTPGNSYDELVNVDAELEPGAKRVVPGDAEASLLYQVLQGPTDHVPQMPQGMPKLPRSEIDAIAEWINTGAEDN